MKVYNGKKYYGRKGFYATCGGVQTEPRRTIHIPLTIWKLTIIIDTGVQMLMVLKVLCASLVNEDGVADFELSALRGEPLDVDDDEVEVGEGEDDPANVRVLLVTPNLNRNSV